MTVKELVDEYCNAKKLKRDYDFKKHLRITYMSYADKLSLARSLINNTSYIVDNGRPIYKRNTCGMLFVFTVQLIKNYTNIEIDDNQITADYDLLMESGAMHGLMEQIPAEEISILRGMVDMERDDLEANTRSVVAFLETKFNSLELTNELLTRIADNPAVFKKNIESDNT